MRAAFGGFNTVGSELLLRLYTRSLAQHQSVNGDPGTIDHHQPRYPHQAVPTILEPTTIRSPRPDAKTPRPNPARSSKKYFRRSRPGARKTTDSTVEGLLSGFQVLGGHARWGITEPGRSR